MNKNDAVETMGKILPDEIPVGTRDAVHVAVIAATAGMPLRAGDHVSYDKGEANGNQRYSKYIGIVDPFLEGTVKTGQTFWLFLYPRTVTGLKHVWEHPDLTELSDKDVETIKDVTKKVRTEADVTATRADAVEYLHQWAGEHGVSYKSMLVTIKECINDEGELDDYINLGTGSSEEIDDPEEFWTNVGLVLNVDIKNKTQITYFTCSC